MYRIMFICTGNACRSAAAESILKKMLADKSIADVEVCSAGTLHGWEGQPRDPVMTRIAAEYGYVMEGTTTQATSEQLDVMDLILVMTDGHKEEVKRLTRHDHWDRIYLFMEYCFGKDEPLPDPSYENETVYRTVFDRIERGCRVIADRLKPRNVTPDFIQTLRDNEIFVFGCRRSGRHWEGAAAFALENFGAKFGQGEGPQGQSYAIATAGVGLKRIQKVVDRFIKYAQEHPEKQFLVNRIGCGLGGWRVWQIAPLFRKAAVLNNIALPQEFWDELMDK